MGKKKKSYAVSPFRKNLVIPEGTKLVKLLQGKESQLSLVAGQTGEEMELLSFTRRKVDKEEFIKYYTNTISIQHNLGLAGRRALDVLQDAIQSNGIDRDQIWLGLKVLEAWNARDDIIKPISESAWYRGLDDLLANNILARNDCGRQAEYWLNPSIMFNGKRQVIVDLVELDEQLIEGELLTEDKQQSIEFDPSE